MSLVTIIRSASCDHWRQKPSYEPQRDKTNKMSVSPAKTQIRLGIRPVWSESSLVRMKQHWVISFPLSAQRRLWSDWADAQADLSLRWTHTHFVGFVMSRLLYKTIMKIQSCNLEITFNNRHHQSQKWVSFKGNDILIFCHKIRSSVSIRTKWKWRSKFPKESVN